MTDDRHERPDSDLFDFSAFEEPPEPPTRRRRARKRATERSRSEPPAISATPIEDQLSARASSRPTEGGTPIHPEPTHQVERSGVSVDAEPELSFEDVFEPGSFFASDIFAPSPSLAEQVPPALPFQPALEGLRGVAILAVLAFLAGVPILGGGFLAISTFLTLTGFLVTRNLLGRWLNGESLLFGAVTKSRLRRLMPIVVLGVLAGTVYTVVLGDVRQVSSLFMDVLSSLSFTSNWRFIAERGSYLSLLSSPSTLEHYWTLAVAEQVNLLVLGAALLAGVAVARFRGGVRRQGSREAVGVFTAVIGILTAASLACTWFLGYSHSRVYLGTDTRAAELLLGALLAVLLVHRPHLGSSRYAGTITIVAPIAAAASLALWVLTPLASPWVYSGGLGLYALVSTAVIAGCLVPGSPLVKVLSVQPLREIGRIAFGLYVFSWPVFVLLTPERFEMPGPVLFLARIAVTVGLAYSAHRYIDTPARAGRKLWGFKLSSAVGGTIAMIILMTMAAASDTPAPATDLSQPYTAAGANIGDGVLGIPSLAVFGDSTAIPIQRGITDYVESTNRAVSRQGRFAIGCGIVPGGAWQLGATTGDTPQRCAHLPDEWAQAIQPGAPTMAIVTPGLLEVADRQLPGDGSWRAIGTPEVDDYYRGQLLAITDTLAGKGAKVIWLTMAPMVAGASQDARPSVGAAADPARAERLNELIAELKVLRPGRVEVIDLAGWLEQNDPDGHLYRPDGFHLSDEGATTVVQTFLAPKLLELAGFDPTDPAALGLPATGASIPGLEPPSPRPVDVCAALGAFSAAQASAEKALELARAEREKAFVNLLSTGGDVQQSAPELNESVEARQRYWSQALGLAMSDDDPPATRPPEGAEQQAATASLEQHRSSHCR